MVVTGTVLVEDEEVVTTNGGRVVVETRVVVGKG
jgi:hypothetical protein